MPDRRLYAAPTVTVFGEGVEETLLDRARRVVEAAHARPGDSTDLEAPELPRLLMELGVAVWGYEQTQETPEIGRTRGGPAAHPNEVEERTTASRKQRPT